MGYTNNEKLGIIAGCLIGDAGKSRSSFWYQHSLSQLDFALHKKSLIEQIIFKECSATIKHQGKYSSIRVYVKVSPLVGQLVGELWTGDQRTNKGIKILTKSFLDYLTPQGIALWYMDDGSMSYKKRDGTVRAMEITLNTYTSIEQNQTIIDYFREKWNLIWNINKSKNSFRMRMGTREGRKLFQIIRPYVIPSMAYKIRDFRTRRCGP